MALRITNLGAATLDSTSAASLLTFSCHLGWKSGIRIITAQTADFTNIRLEHSVDGGTTWHDVDPGGALASVQIGSTNFAEFVYPSTNAPIGPLCRVSENKSGTVAITSCYVIVED